MLGYPGGPSIITKVIINEEKENQRRHDSRRRSQNRDRERFEERFALLALQMENEAMNKGRQVAPRSRRRQRNRFSTTANRMWPHQHLDFGTSDLQNYNTVSLSCSKLLSL